MDETRTIVQDAMDAAPAAGTPQETPEAREADQAVGAAAPAEAAPQETKPAEEAKPPVTPEKKPTPETEQPGKEAPAEAAGKEEDAAQSPAPNPVMERLFDAEVRAAAAMAGVPREKIPYVLRLCDKTGASQQDADFAALAEKAVKQALTDIPELKGAAPAAGSLGDHKRMPGTAEQQTASAFAQALRG